MQRREDARLPGETRGRFCTRAMFLEDLSCDIINRGKRERL